jgi:bifunctional UDP-N-acetylglucosamine pyrophosphorylase / glucosamine-1-phosphate N-acetyltransferase
MITSAVLLAAGQGTRMKSALPKVLHPLLGRPMIFYSLETLQAVTAERPVVVIGHGAAQIEQVGGEAADFVWQEPQLGTGHAVQQVQSLLEGKTDQVLVTLADMPLLTPAALQSLVRLQEQNSGPISMLTLIADDPRGFGRIVRAADGQVQAIVEEAQASVAQLQIHELNASVYCFNAAWLWRSLSRIPISPKGEYYLTDLVAIAVQDGLTVQAIVLDDPQEAIGVNTHQHLAEAEAILRQRINAAWMLAGVTLIDPAHTYIEPGARIGQDTVIWPNTFLQGKTTIGAGCEIGPNTVVRDSILGDRCKVVASMLENAWLEDDVDAGPYTHLRRGAHLEKGVHIGNFGEIKNSILGPGVKMGHFSYIGDATIGEQVNIGAGTITCNFDGEKKNQTEIGAGAFIGSDTMLVAPVTVGAGAHTGAGAVVTKNIPPDTLAVGVPARNIRKLKARGE